jgi:two-component system cell cycle response regulator
VTVHDDAAIPRPARVLIVDDERANRQLLEIMLGPEGYELATATRGEEALASMTRQVPDIVLLDVMMPGMNGYVVTARIKANPETRHVIVLLLSSLDDPSSRAHGANAGADGLLSKPVDRRELCDLVASMLARRAAAKPSTGDE